ncbi:hypothetical protein ACGFZR_15470 [Streptomyces sp. NPDC048241]|uniref:hypothetical protein n=1 Tax=Streptomyces sp. NPDC048241 TaxID=3365521 RepID=UPI00370FEEE6
MSVDHRAEAEKHLSLGSYVKSPTKPHPVDPEGTDFHLRMAQIHATLAAGQTAAADAIAYRHTIQTMRFALVRHVAEGLALSEGDEAHQHARGLARHLDSVGLNIDREVDAYIDELGWGDPSDAWLNPTARREKWDGQAAEDAKQLFGSSDPWATDQLPAN